MEGVVNGECKTLREGKTSIFLYEPKTFWLFKLQYRDFKVQDVQTLRGSDIFLQKQTNKSGLQNFLSFAKNQDS